jgi:hypothetical protein
MSANVSGSKSPSTDFDLSNGERAVKRDFEAVERFTGSALQMADA